MMLKYIPIFLILVIIFAQHSTAIGLAHTINIEPSNDGKSSRGVMWGTIVSPPQPKSGDKWELSLTNDLGMIPQSGVIRFYDSDYNAITDEIILAIDAEQFLASAVLVFEGEVSELVNYQCIISFTIPTTYDEFKGVVKYTPAKEGDEPFTIDVFWRATEPAFAVINDSTVVYEPADDENAKIDAPFRIMLNGLMVDGVKGIALVSTPGLTFKLEENTSCAINNHDAIVTLDEHQPHIASLTFKDKSIALHQGDAFRFHCPGFHLISHHKKTLYTGIQVQAIINDNPVGLHSSTTRLKYVDTTDCGPDLYVESSQANGIIMCKLSISFQAIDFFSEKDSIEITLPNTRYAHARVSSIDDLINYDSFYKVEAIKGTEGSYPIINLFLKPRDLTSTYVDFIVAAKLIEVKEDNANPETCDFIYTSRYNEDDPLEAEINHEITPAGNEFCKEVKFSVSRSSNHEKIPFAFEVVKPVEKYAKYQVSLPFLDSHFVGDLSSCTFNQKKVKTNAMDKNGDAFQSIEFILPEDHKIDKSLKFECPDAYLQLASIRSDYLIAFRSLDHANNSLVAYSLMHGKEKASVREYAVYIGVFIALAAVVFALVIISHHIKARRERAAAERKAGSTDDTHTSLLSDEVVNN